MSNAGYLTVASALVFLLAPDVASGSRSVLDQEPLVDSSSLGQLCDQNSGNQLRIIRTSTIIQLHGYIESLSSNEQGACRDFYLEPLTDLKAVLEAGSGDICSFETVQQIDNFHWKYVLGSLSKNWRKASPGTLPEPLKVFFMNYAQEVTEKCKDTLMSRLRTAAGENDAASESLYANKMGFVIDQLSNVLQPKDKIKNHDDFVLLVERVVDKERRRGRPVEHEIDSVTGEEIIASFKLKDTEKIWMVQQKCRQQLRPVYKQTVLPVMRLISLGFGNPEKHARDDVAGSELVKNWYAITQLCQLVLPINFYLDKSLEKDQMVAMEGTANPSASEEILPPVSETPFTSVEIKPVQLDDIISDATNEKVATLIKSNLKARNQIFRRIIKSATKLVNGELRSIMKNLLVKRKVGDKYVVENGEEMVKGQLEGQEAELLNDDDELENRKAGLLARNKRGLSNFFLYMTYAFGICVVVAIIALVIFLLAGGSVAALG